MKITKTTLLFIATLFFLALPMMFTSGNAQAVGTGQDLSPDVFNGDGATHDATTHGWSYPLPSQTGTCVGAYPSTPAGTPAATLNIDDIGPRENCSSIAPAWVLALNETDCNSLGYAWSTSSLKCGNSWTDAGNYFATFECLYCHNGGHGYNMSGYLKGGHKNMSRPADGIPWTTSIEYGSSDVPGYDWTTAVPANGVAPASPSSVNGKALYWIYDGWLSDTPRAVSDSGLGVCSDSQYTTEADCSGAGETWNANQPVASYACGRCHTTGWTADASIQTTKEPEASFPGINNIVNLSAADDSGTSQPYSSWDHFGILCSLCHNAVNNGHQGSYSASNPYGNPYADPNLDMDVMSGNIPAMAASQNKKCYNCHRQVDGKNLPLEASTLKIGEQLRIKAGHGGGLGITSHANGYLNSPHARFSGTYGQLGDSSMYDSHFITNDGGCAGCHNVHDSLTDSGSGIDTHAPWNNECGLDCHVQDPGNPYGKPLSAIQHPAGPGTPLYGVSADDPVKACQVCHMPDGLHLFRISTDANYETFPVGSAGTDVPTVADPDHNNFPSAYVDLDLACGQCHGGSAGQSATTNGAPYMDKASLAAAASVMHDGTAQPSRVSFTWWDDSSNAGVVNFNASGGSCPTGVTCNYTWDFGDGSTGTGVAVSHQYSTPYGPETVTLTVSGAGSATQVVTPADVHQGPTCDGTITPTISGMDVSFSGGITAHTDTAPGVYVNWGDGSPLSVGNTSGPFTHTYMWTNNTVGYKVTEIVQDNEGFSCVNTAYVKIGNSVIGSNSISISASGAWITNSSCTADGVPAPCCTGSLTGTCGDTAITSPVTYYVKDGNGLTKATGTVAVPGSTTANNLPTDLTNYTVTFYYPTGHSCTPTSTTTTSHSGPVDASSGSASVSACN
ncbi:MAG: PKD domain-containing protein [Candidatus Sulfobium sp.]|jgi:hypothetical protein